MGILNDKRPAMLRSFCLMLLLAATTTVADAQQYASRASVADTLTPHQPTRNERRARRGLTSTSTLFVPRGQWIFGGTGSYSYHVNDSYTFTLIEGIVSEGYTVRVSPMIGYAVGRNTAVGTRFIYSRTLLRVDAASLKVGDEDSGVDIGVEDYYALQHNFTGALFWRQYIPLGESKRFAIFTEMQLTAGGTQGKFAADQPVRGTFERGYKIGLGLSPGLIAFATNNMAIEVNVGVMGVNYSSAKQVHNQVSVGRRSASSMSFRVNLLAIGLGVAFYL